MQDVKIKKTEINNINLYTAVKKSNTYVIVKRLFDFISSLAVGIVLLIPMVIISFAIICKDHREPFYRQKRIGLNGQPLYIYKFRSMRKGADDLKNMLLKEQKLLLFVKPGLTGYWQAYARNNAGYEDHKRQDMELFYIQNQSFCLI